MLPVEFVVTGPPVSHQSHNPGLLRAWQSEVRAAARAAIPPGMQPITVECRLSILYAFPGQPVRADADNLTKPISDALNGVVFVDDWLVSDLIFLRRRTSAIRYIPNLPPVLIDALEGDEDFVYVHVGEVLPEGMSLWTIH